MCRTNVCLVAVVSGLMGLMSPLGAQNFPERPITISFRCRPVAPLTRWRVSRQRKSAPASRSR